MKVFGLYFYSLTDGENEEIVLVSKEEVNFEELCEHVKGLFISAGKVPSSQDIANWLVVYKDFANISDVATTVNVSKIKAFFVVSKDYTATAFKNGRKEEITIPASTVVGCKYAPFNGKVEVEFKEWSICVPLEYLRFKIV